MTDDLTTVALITETVAGLADTEWAGDRDDLARGLAAAEDLARHARRIREDITAALVAVLDGARRVEVDGLGVLEVRGGRKRSKWDTTELARHLVHCALVDGDTGELRAATPSEAAQIAIETLAACAPFTPSMAWRVGALRDRDVDPDEWCESTPAPPTVQITRSAAP